MSGFRFTAVLLLCTFLAAFATSFHDGLHDRLGAYRVLWPQEWSFFTDLDHESAIAYRPGDDRALGRQSAGFGRAADGYLSETRRIAVRVPDGYWQPCGRPRPSGCVVDRQPVVTIESPAREPYLCGPVVIALERVERTRPDEPPGRVVPRVALVDVRCG